MPKNAVGLFNTCYYFAFARTFWGYRFALQFNPKLLAKFAPLGVLNAAEAATKMDDLAGRHTQVTGVESQLVMDTVRKTETVGLATWGYDSLQLLAAAQLGFVRTTVQKIDSMERRRIQPAAPPTNIPAVAQPSAPEAPVTTSAFNPEILKEIMLRGASPSEVLAATSACHKELLKEIIPSRARLPEPEAPVTTSAYNPENLKEIILRGAPPSEVLAATSACHKELMKEIVSSKATTPDMDYHEQVMHYLTTKWPDRSLAKLNARPSRATLSHQATSRASYRDHLAVNKHALLFLCIYGIATYFFSRLLAKNLQPLIEFNRARHALSQTASGGAGTEMRAYY